MKKTILLAAMAIGLFTTNVFAQKIKGSDTCLPVSQTEAENFMNKHKSTKVTITDWQTIVVSLLSWKERPILRCLPVK